MADLQQTYFGGQEINDTSQNASTIKVEDNIYHEGSSIKTSTGRNDKRYGANTYNISQTKLMDNSSLELITTQLSKKKFVKKGKIRNDYGV